jgi:hypothetical protein
MLAARAWELPVMSSERLAPTNAVLATLGPESCTAPKKPSNGTTSGETLRMTGKGTAAWTAGARRACSTDAAQTERLVNAPPEGNATRREVE